MSERRTVDSEAVARQLEEADRVLAESRAQRARSERTLAETRATLDWARRKLGLRR